VEKFIPPKKGTSHILRIIRELIDFKAESQRTNIAEALRYLTNIIKKRCTAFLISDFLDQRFEDALRIASNKHDVVALQIYDQRETDLPDIGLLRIHDRETGEKKWIDTSDTGLRMNYRNWWVEHEKAVQSAFTRSGVDSARIATDQDYVRPIMNLFKQRGAKR